MKKISLILCFMFLATGFAGQALAVGYNNLASFLADAGPVTLVNFDTDQNGNAFTGALAGRYTSWGVDFGAVDYAGGALGPVSSPNGWFVPGDPYIFTAFFSLPDVKAVGVHNVLNSAQNGATLYAWDAADNLIESVNSDADINSLDFFGVITASPIAKMTVQIWSPPYGWGLDDLYFGGAVAPVPVPAAIWLLASGLVGLIGLRKMSA